MYTKDKKINRDIFVYTLIFVVTAIFVFIEFITKNKTFIWGVDGLAQHFPAMYEVRENLLSIIKSGFKDIPFWNWNLGLGINLSFIYTYDIFYWIAILIPEKFLVSSYSAFIILKLYLAGLFIILYLREIKIEGYSSIIAALTYSFCGYALFAGPRHPFFITPMLIFPLMILGVERYITKGKYRLMIFSIFLATISHYYFLYMMGIGMVIYSVVRYLSLNEKHIFTSIFKLGLKSIVGIGLGAFAILPNIIMFFKSNRIGSEYSQSILYKKKYYVYLITSYIAPENNSSWTILMFSGIIIIIFPLLFSKAFKEYKYIRNTFLVMTLMLCIPYIGYAMNGFSSVSNRWVFMYSFFVSSIVGIGLKKIDLYENKHMIISKIVIILYIIVVLVFKGIKIENLTSILFTIFILMVISLRKVVSDIKYNKVINIILLIAVVSNIIYISHYFYSSNGINYANEFIDNKDVLERYKNISDFTTISEDDSFFRVTQMNYASGNENKNIVTLANDGLISNVNSSGQYISMLDNEIYKFYIENEININMSHAVSGYDNRSSLESLLGVKYKIIKDNEDVYIGKGYNLKEVKEDYILYENTNVLPIGIFYSEYMKKESFNQLNAVDKSMSFLQGVSLDVDNSLELNEIEPKIYSSNIPYRVEDSDGVKLLENNIKVDKEGAELVLKADLPAESEIYLQIKGLDKKESKEKTIHISRNNSDRFIKLQAKGHIYSSNQKDKTISLGYIENRIENDEIVIKFKDKGTYTFDSLELKSVDMSDYDRYIDELKKNGLQNIKYSSNEVSGNINASSDGVMFFSIPYNKGWTIKVDGKKIESFKVNSEFLGCKLSEGYHEINIKFCPPGLKIGIVCTILSIFICFIMHLKRKKVIFY